ncbi:hypothetical protein RUM44_009137 [Polyplax serrata]|uniref:Protein msta n=1 Tax=Polyplax serrata TaxID=468196 RepID=A0ABR1ASH1_POLSC
MADQTEGDVEKCRICSMATPNRCTSCKKVAYCSREHQKEDWKNHKVNCRAFQIRSSLELGRFMEATRPIGSGEVLFSELPIVVGPGPEVTVCLGCYDPAPQERCPQCFWPVCSTSCPGVTDPDHHGTECVIFQMYTRRVEVVHEGFFTWVQKGGQHPINSCAMLVIFTFLNFGLGSCCFYRYDAIFPLRCLLLQRRNPKGWKVLLEMESHRRKRGPNTEAYKQADEKVVKFLEENFFKLLTKAENDSKADTKLLPERSPEILQKICGIIDVNALEIQLTKGTTLNALYPAASLMEHSCLPNTRHSFQCHPSKGFRLKVLANQDIQPGSHISTMYTHALWGTQQRQDHLRSTKYFTCRCKRCGDPSELGTNLSGLRCLAPGLEQKICGGTQLPVGPLDLSTVWKCDKCPTSLTSEQVAEFVNMIGREVDHVQERSPTVSSLETLLEKLKKLLHKNHYHCFSVMHSLVQLYGREPGHLIDQMNNQTVEKKIRMCKQLLSITHAIDPTASRLALYSSVAEQELASAVLTLAKRRLWTGDELTKNLQEARQHLLHATASLEPEIEENSAGAKVALLVTATLDELVAFCRVSNVPI